MGQIIVLFDVDDVINNKAENPIKKISAFNFTNGTIYMCVANKEKQNLISQEHLKQLFDYDSSTGNLIRKNHNYKSYIGQVAGCRDNKGYIVIKIHGKPFKAHRLVWLYHNGVWPEELLDHMNMNRSDNRIENLREVSHQENSKHQKIHSNNSSGHCGVSWNKNLKKFHALVKFNNKRIHLGYFSILEDAIAARKAAELQHNFSPYHGNVNPLPNVVYL